jgi:hypothetical protein
MAAREGNMSGNLLSAGLFRLTRGYELTGQAFKVFLFGPKPALIEEFISIWTIPLLKTKRRALPSAGNEPMPYRPHPVHPRRLFPRPGLNASVTFECPRFP